MGRLSLSDGTINLPLRATPPDPPTIGRVKIWASSTDGKPRITDENGVTSSFEPAYGSLYFSSYRDTFDSNNSTTPELYHSLAYTGADIDPLAEYEISAHFVWNHSSASNDIICDLELNGSPIGEEFRVEPKDTGTDQRIHAPMKYKVTGAELATTNGNIDFYFRASSGGNTSRMYFCLLTILRVK